MLTAQYGKSHKTFVKRFFLGVLIICLLSQCVNISVFAENEFSFDEANQILIEAYNRTNLIYRGYTLSSDDRFFRDDRIELAVTEVNVAPSATGEVCMAHKYVYDESFTGEKYIGGRTYNFYEVADSRFDTMEKCYAYIGDVFSERLSKLIIDRNGYDLYPMECFRPREGGFEIIHGEKFGGDLIPTTPGKVMYMERWRHLEFRPNTKKPWDRRGVSLISADSLSVKGDYAVLTVTALVKETTIRLHETNLLNLYEKKLEVLFTKTNNGWKIFGGSFIELLINPYITTIGRDIKPVLLPNEMEISESPSTGDASPAVVGLALAALVSLAAPFVVKRRRVR